jgi:hypothetical protein
VSVGPQSSAFGGTSAAFGGTSAAFGGGGPRPDWRAMEALGLTADELNLLRTGQTVETLSRRAQALGAEDISGQGRRGFLEGALDYITRPQSAVLGFATGLAGITQEGEETNPFLRALYGLSGRERYQGSDIVGKAGEDASLGERGLRAAASLGIDIATDPLTYLTFGAGGAIRGVGRAVTTEADVMRAARAVLPDVPKTPPALPPLEGTATRAAFEGAQARAAALTGQPGAPVTPSLSQAPLSAPEAIAQAPSTVQAVAPIGEDFLQRLATSAGAGQAVRGGRGVREALEREIAESGRYAPEDAEKLSREIFGQLRGETRGGVGLRIPFASTRFANLTPGGGVLTDRLGLTAMAEATRGIYNAYRGTKLYESLATSFGGRFGEEYAKFIRGAVKGDGDMTYDAMRTTMKIGKDQKATKAAYEKQIQGVFKAATDMLNSASDPEAARLAAIKFSQRPGIAPAANATESERIGYETTRTLRSAVDALWSDYNAERVLAGMAPIESVDVGEFFIGRPTTPAWREYTKKRGRAFGRFDPTAGRVVPQTTDEFGKLRSQTPEELNRIAQLPIEEGGWGVPKNIQVYETDPFVVLAHQATAYIEDILDVRLLRQISNSLPLEDAVTGVRRYLDTPKFKAAGEAGQQELRAITARLKNLLSQNPDQKTRKRISDAIDELANSDAAIQAIISNIPADPRVTDERIGTLVAHLKAAADQASKTRTGQDTKELRKLWRKAEKLTTEQTINLRAPEFQARGLVPLRLRGEGVQEINIPQALTDKWAPEAIRDAVQKFYSVERGSSIKEIRSFVDNFYMPYYVAFKTTATIGRPGGFQARNFIGAAWNNWLVDVGRKDYNITNRVLMAQHNAKVEARKAVDNLKAGRDSGLTGAEDAVAKASARLGRTGGRSADAEIDDLADVIFARELEKIKVGDYNAKQILDYFESQQLGRDSRRLEYLRQEAEKDVVELMDALVNPEYVNLFRGLTRAELNAAQKAVNGVVNFKPLRMSANLTDLQERYVRLAPFISGVRRYGLEDGGEAAAYLVKATQFDYSDLSQFERGVMKNILPFYVWSRKNVPLQFFSLFAQPGKFNALGYTKQELETYFGAAGDEEGMVDIVPEWMRERMGFTSRFEFKGQPILLGMESPALDINKFLAFGGLGAQVDKGSQEVLSATNPLLKSFVEVVTGVDLFTGGKIPDDTPSLLGEVPFPGTYIGEDGKRKMDAMTVGVLKDIVPPLGYISRVSGRGQDADRQLTNILSAAAGLPVATGTVRQQVAELRSREDRIRKQINKIAIKLGADRQWLEQQLDAGATADEIRNLLAQGYGRRPDPVE